MSLKNRLARLMHREGVTPLPTKILVTLFFVVLCDMMTVAMVFSYLPKLVKSFGTSEVDTGLYAGIIASSLYIGRTLFSLIWGHIADVKGNKLVLICSTVLVMFATLAFAFANSFYWAVATRFIQGASSALLVISKSVLAENCDDTNMASAISILFSSGSIGYIIGPSLAGFLVFPLEQYPSVFKKGSIFERFAILIPNLFLTICFAASIILVVLFVPQAQRNNNELSPLLQSPAKKYQSVKITDCEDTEMKKKMARDTARNSGFRMLLLKFKTLKCVKVLSIKECVQVSFLYGIYSCAAIGGGELLPLFFATAMEYNGMEFSTSKIGLTFLMISATLLPSQFLLIPRAVEYFGSRKLFIGSNLLSAFLFPWLPMIVEIMPSSTGLWMVVVFVIVLQKVSMLCGFVAINVLINNTVASDMLGSANGLGMSFSSIGRSIGPAFIGSIYTWSLTNIKDISSNTNPIGFPFNQYFSFYVLSLFYIIIGAFGSIISPALDKKKTIQNCLNAEPSSSTTKI